MLSILLTVASCKQTKSVWASCVEFSWAGIKVEWKLTDPNLYKTKGCCFSIFVIPTFILSMQHIFIEGHIWEEV